jgi:hypothetical protein
MEGLREPPRPPPSDPYRPDDDSEDHVLSAVREVESQEVVEGRQEEDYGDGKEDRDQHEQREETVAHSD